jgi:hypothetical protein
VFDQYGTVVHMQKGLIEMAAPFAANHAFDCIGAKSYGMRAAFIDRRRRSFGETPRRPALTLPTLLRSPTR